MNEHLGRGLSALIPDREETPDTRANLGTLPLDRIRANPYQPRQNFDPDSLAELAESIKANGIIQPLIVTKAEGRDYELIAGERRLQAAKLAGLDMVPVVIRSVSQREQLQLAIVENIQREDLDPIEEARAYQTLAEDFGLTHQQVAQIVSKERVTITNSIRLLNLPGEVKTLVSAGQLSPGHARAVLAVEAELQPLFAQHIIQYRLTVRQAEDKAKSFAQARGLRQPPPETAQVWRKLESELQRALGLKARIKDFGGRGRITLSYSSPEELARLKELLKQLRSL
ncbi:MAG TPA: ParB/RepB/Spo0J family partition protein [Candidatus Syntrophosphaera sp.]|nr:ParB/RepB/Spo0J family partition protein [Candidatus Syntrophosphaera sp.]